MLSKPFKYSAKMTKIDVPRSASSHSSTNYQHVTTPINRFRVIRKIQNIKPENSSLQAIFKAIGDDKSRINIDDFRRFLNLRYPAIVTESICKSFHFKQTTYEDYVQEMNKFESLSEERHLSFCFDIFDFNKDKKITTKDTFTAMEIRTDNYYDDDIVMIKHMFDLIREGKIKNKHKGNRLVRRRSTFSLITDNQSKNKTSAEPLEENNIKKKQYKNIALNYKDFCTIKFIGRPQIFQDFLLYTTGYNYLLERGYIRPQPAHSAKDSITIVVEMNVNPEFNEKLRNNEMYEYYCSLDSAMEMYSKKQLEDLMKKFKFLQSETHLNLKLISKKSMVKKLVINN